VTGTRLRESWDVLASRHHITIQLEDRLPAPLRDVNNTDKDDLILCYPPHTDPPIWILSFNSLGITQAPAHSTRDAPRKTLKADYIVI